MREKCKKLVEENATTVHVVFTLRLAMVLLRSKRTAQDAPEIPAVLTRLRAGVHASVMISQTLPRGGCASFRTGIQLWRLPGQTRYFHRSGGHSGWIQLLCR